MKVSLTVKDAHAQLSLRASKVDPNKQIAAPIYQIVIQDEHGETQFNLSLITTSREVYEKFQLGQTVEVEIFPKGKLVLVGGTDVPESE